MRKSAAPSMRKATKRCVTSNSNGVSSSRSVINDSTENAEEDYKWGSASGNLTWQERLQEKYENLLTTKRVFNIVWREITLKKNKTWKGDGTLEIDVRSGKAVLKDDTGKYLGSCQKTKVEDFEKDVEMTVGNKEILLLEEIKSLEQLEKLKKQEFENRAWGVEECLHIEPSTKKPKGAYVFNYPVNLDRPQLSDRISVPVPEQNISNTNNQTLKRKNNLIVRECLCLLRSSELQQYLFEKLKEIYLNNVKSVDKNELFEILQKICNHPSLINTMNSGRLIEMLQPHLPEWSLMGPYDSSKLEFLQTYLSKTVIKCKETIFLIGQGEETIIMLKNFCEFLNLQCTNLEDIHNLDDYIDKKILDNISNSLGANVLLVEPKDSSMHSSDIHSIIFFNCFRENKYIISSLKRNCGSSVHIYQLITAGCYEEYHYKSNIMDNVGKSDHNVLDAINGEFSEELLTLLNKQTTDETNWQCVTISESKSIFEEFKLEDLGDTLLMVFTRFYDS